MATTIILTLIVPAYNMGKYLQRCLCSLNLTGVEPLEVIVVNDGSTDDTLGIAREFEKEYPDIIKVTDKNNGGYGSSINAALKQARGEFVKILDADDALDAQALAEFLDFLSESDADAVISDFEKVDAHGRYLRKYSYALPLGKAFSIDSLSEEKDLWVHSVTYRSRIFNGLDYHQSEGIHYTDQEWLFLPMGKVRSLRYFPWTLYYYTCGRNGQSISTEVYASHISDEIKGIKVMLEEYVAIRPQDSATDRYLISRLNYRTNSLYSMFLLYCPVRTDTSLLVEFDEFLKNYNLWYYELSNSIEVPMKAVHFRYIADWRHNGRRMSLPLKLFGAYKRLRKALLG